MGENLIISPKILITIISELKFCHIWHSPPKENLINPKKFFYDNELHFKKD